MTRTKRTRTKKDILKDPDVNPSVKHDIELREKELSATKPKEVESWYTIVSGKKLIKKTKTENGAIYSNLLCMTSDRPDLVKELQAKGLIRY